VRSRWPTYEPRVVASRVSPESGGDDQVWLQPSVTKSPVGLPTGERIAAYGPRGSEAVVADVRAGGPAGHPAVLLANHGVLVFHRTPDLAIRVGGVVGEAARAGIKIGDIGVPWEIPEHHREAIVRHAMTIERAGTARVWLSEGNWRARRALGAEGQHPRCGAIPVRRPQVR